MSLQPRAIGVLIGGIALAGAAVPAWAGIGGTYQGHLAGDETARVEFKVITGSKGGRKPRVRFTATDIPLSCEDGQQVRRSFAPDTVRLNRSGAFYKRDYMAPGGEYFYLFAGDLESHGRANGGIKYDDLADDDPTSIRCATDGTLKWRAEQD